MTEDYTLREKLSSLYYVASFQPLLASGILVLAMIAAGLEGIGLSFLVPIIELSQGQTAASSASGVLKRFLDLYEFLGISFTLEYTIIGISGIMIVRYSASFAVGVLKTAIQQRYLRSLQKEAFDHALTARTAYFDQNGSDDILNAIVTQARQGSSAIDRVIGFLQQVLLSLVYFSIALYLAPVLTLSAVGLLGGISYVFRNLLQSGSSLGETVAAANENVQRAVQAGMQGIRDVKLFRVTDELFSDFDQSINTAVRSNILLSVNQSALRSFYQLITAITVFAIIYFAITVSSMSLASLGMFLFAMFRLAPRVSNLNSIVYAVDSDLPHLIRTQEFIDELKSSAETSEETNPAPSSITEVEFEDVTFAYDTGEQIFEDLSFSFETGDFIAFVGPSGAGKSTVVSLLTRLYEPDAGEILADGTPITEYDIEQWRSRISVVRQNPFIFNESLRWNVTIGNREASQQEIEEFCEIAQVTEFLDDLPNGYNTVLGDDGVRLSGGQKQRVALARALLKDADFLILDEGTSDLDSNIEETVHDAIESMSREYGMLVIAHRLSTVTNADRIYTLEDGQIRETGSHDKLVENNGIYADLYATQTTKTEPA